MDIYKLPDYDDFPVDLDSVKLPDQLPPVLIIAFTRPDLLEQVIESLASQTLFPGKIIAIVDGSRNKNDEPLIEECIRLLEEFPHPVEIIRRPHNMGCDRNVVAAISEVLERYDSLVYLEDDIVLNPYFYDRMCRLLTAYRNVQDVFSVTAYASLALSHELIQTDFFPSRRVFSWGFGIWADRWRSIDFPHVSEQHNPFGQFYQIPATPESKLILVNQFWMEKNNYSDWVITLNLAALAQNRVHILPKDSFIRNIGFGHEQSKTYRGKEGSWVNSRYCATARPNSLPSTLRLHERLGTDLSGVELARFFTKKNLWLMPQALLYLIRKYPQPKSIYLWTALFLKKLPTVVGRWRAGHRV
jgi:glycosyltransferase involved in cell wall biosynthesis